MSGDEAEAPPAPPAPAAPPGGGAPSLKGRCGSCVRFVRVVEKIDENGEVKRSGECLLGVWPSPLYENNGCGQWVEKGTFKAAPVKPTRLARGRGESFGGGRGSSRSDDVDDIPSGPITLPEDLLEMDADEFKRVLTQVIREELGVTRTPIGQRWQGGEVVLVPGKEGTQEKRIPIDALFHKIVMIRDKLRVLEQKINAHTKLADDEKVAMQQYITGCYGSLTTFNVLFSDKADGFSGAKGDD